VKTRTKAAAAMAALCLTGACCGLFQSKEERYKKEMECALRVTDNKSIEILQKGMYCCEALPAGAMTLPQARRFYLERALKLNPDSTDAMAAVAKSYWDEGSYPEGLKFYQMLEKKSEKPLSAVIGEYTMYRLMKKWDDAAGRIAWIRQQKAIDAAKVGDYLEGRLLYDEGKYPEALPLLQNAIERANAGDDSLGNTPYTMKDAAFWVAQIKLKGGDPQGAYEAFKEYLHKMADPDFQIFYAYWLPRMGSDQAKFYDTIETQWAHVRQ
jgi:tetratricopeptide (TPR) repeat protein